MLQRLAAVWGTVGRCRLGLRRNRGGFFTVLCYTNVSVVRAKKLISWKERHQEEKEHSARMLLS